LFFRACLQRRSRNPRSGPVTLWISEERPCCVACRPEKPGPTVASKASFLRRSVVGVEGLRALADLIGHACVALAAIHELIERHVLAGAWGHQDSAALDLCV